MSVWHNPTEHTLRFTVRDEAYQVVPGAELTLPDFFDWLPPSRGLPLVKGPSPVDRAPRVVPTMAEKPHKAPLPLGVTSGAAAVLREQREIDDAYEADDEDDETTAGSESDAVAKTVEKLQKQGVRVPGKR